MKKKALDFDIGNQFPVRFIGTHNLNIPNTVNTNGKKFKKVWDLLIELDVCEYLDENKKVLIDREGNRYSGGERKKFYFDRRYLYYTTISKLLEEVDFSTLEKDLRGHVSRDKIQAVLQTIMKFFISIEYYEVCADIKEYINTLYDNEYEGLRQLIKEIIN